MKKDFNGLDSIIEKHDNNWANVVKDIGETVTNPEKRMNFYIDILGKTTGDSNTIEILHKEMQYTKTEITEQRNELAIANLNMAKYAKELEGMAMTDKLTELYNKRFFDTTLNKAIARADRGNENTALIIADIDRFKLFNDG